MPKLPIFPTTVWVFPEASPTKVTTPLPEISLVKSDSNFISPEEIFVFMANTSFVNVTDFPLAPFAFISFNLFVESPTCPLIVDVPARFNVPWLSASVVIVEFIFLPSVKFTVPSSLYRSAVPV